MPYSSQADMINRYGLDAMIQLTDRAEPPAGAIDPNVLAANIANADALIDTYIRKRYELPLATVPTMLNATSMALAYFYLSGERVSETTRQGYDDAMKYLRDLSRGDALLDVSGLQPTSAPAEATVDAPPRMFDRCSLRRL